MDAHEKADPAALAAVLSEDVKLTMPPLPFWFSGRDAVEAFAFGPDSPLHLGRWRCVLTRANRQPAVAGYLLPPGESVYRAQTLNVLRLAGEKIAEITVFEPHLLATFGLPLSFPASSDPF
jgi:RNA polymerase sigma-70 factor (ECF subfamily)